MKRSSAMNAIVLRILLGALLCSTSVVAPASAPQFTYERFTSPGDGRIVGNGINNADGIVGVVDDFGTGSFRRMGFVRYGTDITLIDFPEADALNGTVTNGLDDAGRVVGRFTELTSGKTHGFILHGGQRETFDVPGASAYTEAFDINNRGMIFGRTFLDSDRGVGSAFVRTGEQFSFFRPPDALGPFGSAFYGVNDSGDKVGEVLTGTGFQAFAILDGAYTPFTVPGSYRTVAHGINEADQIVGWYYAPDASTVHGFLMDFTGLYRIDVPAEGSYGTFITGINDAGSIVGAIAFHRFPVEEVIVGSPCDKAGDTCVAASRVGDPLVDFTLKVGIDVKPGSSTNPVGPDAGGVIPVSLMGSAVFHIADVDESRLAFGPAEAAPRHALPVDLNHDGFIDLFLQFRTDETGIAPGHTEACLTGAVISGRHLRGCDVIRTVPPGAGNASSRR